MTDRKTARNDEMLSCTSVFTSGDSLDKNIISHKVNDNLSLPLTY